MNSLHSCEQNQLFTPSYADHLFCYLKNERTPSSYLINIIILTSVETFKYHIAQISIQTITGKKPWIK